MPDVELTKTQAAMLAELGSAEVTRRIANLPAYEKYQALFTFTGYGSGDKTLTPAQAQALAALASALNVTHPGVVILANGIHVPFSDEQKAQTVAQNEIRNGRYRRRWDREAEAARATDSTD